MRAAPDPERDPHDRDDESSGRSGVRSPVATKPAAPSDDGMVPALLANARHELRSPLQSIQGFAELLASEAYGKLSTEQHTFVEHIVQSSLDLGGIVDACVELAERELSGPEQQTQRVNVHTLLGEALEQVRSKAQLSISVRFDDDTTGGRAKLDPAIVRRALSALCGALAGADKALEATLVRDDDDVLTFRLARRSVATSHASGAATPINWLTVPQLIERRRTARGILWLRLAQLLLAAQDATLRVGEAGDRAEVRFRPSSQH